MKNKIVLYMNRNESQKMMTQFHNKYFRQIRTTVSQ